MIGVQMFPFNDVPPAFKTLEEYREFRYTTGRDKAKRLVLERAKQARAWGVRDVYSTGYSQSELCNIIGDLIAIIENE